MMRAGHRAAGLGRLGKRIVMEISNLDDTNGTRVTLRRATHDLNDTVWELAAKVQSISPEAANAIDRAHTALFEAWTYLCTPPEDDDDDHDH